MRRFDALRERLDFTGIENLKSSALPFCSCSCALMGFFSFLVVGREKHRFCPLVPANVGTREGHGSALIIMPLPLVAFVGLVVLSVS